MHDLEIVRHGDQRRRSQRPFMGLRPLVGAKRIGDCGKEFCREEGLGQVFVGREKKGIRSTLRCLPSVETARLSSRVARVIFHVESGDVPLLAREIGVDTRHAPVRENELLRGGSERGSSLPWFWRIRQVARLRSGLRP